MKKFLLGILSIIVVIGLAACGEEEYDPNEQLGAFLDETPTDVTNVPKDQQIGTAGSNMPLKDRVDDAKYEVEVAMQYQMEESFGEKVNDMRIKNVKILTAEDEEANGIEVSIDEVAFEVEYELHPAEDVDTIELTIPNGEFDEETGWIKEKFNLGILTPTGLTEGEDGPKYKIRNYGTGW